VWLLLVLVDLPQKHAERDGKDKAPMKPMKNRRALMVRDPLLQSYGTNPEGMAGRYTGSYLDRRNGWRTVAILADISQASLVERIPIARIRA
jgi:hypothetical protein